MPIYGHPFMGPVSHALHLNQGWACIRFWDGVLKAELLYASHDLSHEQVHVGPCGFMQLPAG